LKKATIDTNVFVSGLLFGGLPLKLLEGVIHRKFTLVISPPLMEEIEKVLMSKKFGLSKIEIDSLTRPFFELADLVIPIETIDVIMRCPADNRVLECAVTGNCFAIVSGDRKDLVSLKNFRGISIMTPRDFYDSIFK